MTIEACLNADLAALEIYGEDVVSFLQGQFSNDITTIKICQYQLSAHLNHKGRILALCIIYQQSIQHYIIISSKCIIEQLQNRLKMYILRSKVYIKAAEYGLCLSQEAASTAEVSCFFSDSCYINSTVTTASASRNNSWHQILISHNIAMIYAETIDMAIPHHLNYDTINVINFNKGCYTGQEIVARTHYLGKVKRRLLKCQSDSLPIIGSGVFANDTQQAVGFMVDYYNFSPDNYIVLISVYHDYIKPAAKSQLIYRTDHRSEHDKPIYMLV
jgi:folate-binding protein YgfZ